MTTFREIFETLKPTYLSVDLRAILVALGEDEGWRCVAAIIRLSSDSVEVVEARQQALVDTHRIPAHLLYTPLGKEHHFGPFRGLNIELSTYPINEFWNLFSRFESGVIVCRTRAFRMWEPEGALSDLNSELVSKRSDQYATDDELWEVYYLGCGQLTTTLIPLSGYSDKQPGVNQSDLDLWSRSAGQPSFRDMFQRILGVRYGSGEAFEIRSPIYARIDELISSDSTVSIKGRYHRSFGQLSVECSIYRTGDHGSQNLIPNSPASRTFSPNADGTMISSFAEEFAVAPMPEMGATEATIFKRDPIRVDLFNMFSRLRTGNLTLKTFTSFVPEEDIPEFLSRLVSGTSVDDCRLFKRFSSKDNSKKIEEILEYVTVYLLGLSELNPILLSNPQYDVITGNLTAGSADILAITKEHDPMLVSCTMAMPDSRKGGMLLAARTAICERLKISEDQIKLVIVTGKPNISEGFPGIRALSATDLINVWKSIEYGDINGARQTFET